MLTVNAYFSCGGPLYSVNEAVKACLPSEPNTAQQTVQHLPIFTGDGVDSGTPPKIPANNQGPALLLVTDSFPVCVFL